MVNYSLILCLFSYQLWSVPIAYDPFELNFHSSTDEEFAFVEHRGMKLLGVLKNLEEGVVNQLEDAKKQNRLVAINFVENPNLARSINDLSQLLFISDREPSNQRYLFNYRDIDYKKKILFGSDYFYFHTADKWHEIQIIKPGLIDEIAAQIKYIKKNKKDVYVNLKQLKDMHRQNYSNAIRAIKIIDN